MGGVDLPPVQLHMQNVVQDLLEDEALSCGSAGTYVMSGPLLLTLDPSNYESYTSQKP